VIVGLAIAMNACIHGWNAAEHRLALGEAKVMAILFYAFAGALVISLAKTVFF
jgi:hypothetical protein